MWLVPDVPLLRFDEPKTYVCIQPWQPFLHPPPDIPPSLSLSVRVAVATVARFGALFFLLLYLSLLSLTSLPVWREDRRLFLSESIGGAYGHLAYFTSVALADILLVRVLPPLAFAVLGYPLMGLNMAPDNQGCLLWFAGILVRGGRVWARCYCL